MILDLAGKNKLGFVDDSLKRLNDELKNLWIIYNNVVTAWILNSLSKEISASVSFFDIALDIWLDLQQ